MATSKSHVVGVTTAPRGVLYREAQWVLQLQKPKAAQQPRTPPHATCRLPHGCFLPTGFTFADASSLSISLLPPPYPPAPPGAQDPHWQSTLRSAAARGARHMIFSSPMPCPPQPPTTHTQTPNNNKYDQYSLLFIYQMPCYVLDMY